MQVQLKEDVEKCISSSSASVFVTQSWHFPSVTPFAAIFHGPVISVKRNRILFYEECIICSIAAPLVTVKNLHLKQMITLTFIGTPDSAPLGPPLPCRPFNKNVQNVVDSVGTIGTTRRRLRYQADISCPSTTSALLFSLLQ